MAKRFAGVLVKLHKWVGLIAALFTMTIALTGTAVVFRDEIDRALNSHLYQGGRSGELAVPLAQAAEQVLHHLGESYRLTFVEFPHRSPSPYVFDAQRSDPQAQDGRLEQLQVYVDSRSGHVLGQRAWGLMPFLVDLHTSLAAGATGKNVLGGIGILLVCLLGSGLYVWWPPKGAFRRALHIHLRGPRMRTYRDLHTVVGAASIPVLLIVVLAGVLLVFDGPVIRAIAAVSPVTPFPADPRSGAAMKREAIGPDAALAVALQRVPDGRPSYITLPLAEQDVYRVKLFRPDQNRPDGDTNLWIDQFSGEVVAFWDPAQFSSADSVIAWVRPLHVGEAFGLPTRVLALLVGLALLTSTVTGALLWNRRRGARRAAAR